VDVVRARGQRHVPLGDVANAFRTHEVGGRHERDVAEGHAAEDRDQRPSGLLGGLDVLGELLEIPIADGAELLEVVARVEPVFVDLALPDDRVEEVAPLRHPAARRRGQVALGMDEDIAVGVAAGVEIDRDQDFEAVGHLPRLPVVVAKAEECSPARDALDVDTHRLLEIVLDEAQHLVGLVDLHGRRLQPVVVPERGHTAHVDPRDGGSTEVDRHSIGLEMAEGRENSVSARQRALRFHSLTAHSVVPSSAGVTSIMVARPKMLVHATSVEHCHEEMCDHAGFLPKLLPRQ